MNFQMPEIGLDFEKAFELYENGPLKDHLDCKNYIIQYLFPTAKATFVWGIEDKREFEFFAPAELSHYLTKLPKQIKTWFLTEYRKSFIPVNDIHAPRVEGKKINLCSGLKFKQPKPYSSFSAEVQEKEQLFISYMHEVLCNRNDQQHEYLKKWTANLCQGKKNDSCLYLKGPEGIGKIFFSETLSEYVLGPQICTIATAEPLRTANNESLCGKLLVMFNELPLFSEREWEGVSAILKTLITEKKAVYSNKYQKSYVADNISNFILNTNVNAIKGSHGRRYNVMDVSTHRREDHEYFGNLANMCKNDIVGEALFSYFSEIDTSNFIPQQIPDTYGKLGAIADRLESPYLFIKDRFILKRKSMKKVQPELYAMFKDFCEQNHSKAITRNEFYAKLREVQIEPRKTNGKYLYDIDIARLNSIASKLKWVHEFDTYEDMDNSDIGSKVTDIGLEPLPTDKEKTLMDEIEILKAKIRELESNKPVKEIIQKIEPEEPELTITEKPEIKPKKTVKKSSKKTDQSQTLADLWNV